MRFCTGSTSFYFTTIYNTATPSGRTSSPVPSGGRTYRVS